MYVAVKGGEKAVRNSRRSVAKMRRGSLDIPEILPEQIENQLGLALDRVMAEGALYDRKVAAKAIQQAQGDLIEAIFLVRAFRTTLKRFGHSNPLDTEAIMVLRRVSGVFKDIPGGQILGPTYDYTHRLIDFESEQKEDSMAALDPEPASGIPEIPDNSPLPRVTDLLIRQGLMKKTPDELIGEKIEDLTRQPLKIPAQRSVRLQTLARGDEGFLLGSAYSLQRGFGLDRHPFLGELRVGFVDVRFTPPELGFEIKIGAIKITECFMVSRDDGTAGPAMCFEAGYGLVFGHNERKAMSMALIDRSLQDGENLEEAGHPAQNQEFILSHSDNVESSGFVQHLKLPHYVDFQSELVSIRNLHRRSYRNKKPNGNAYV